MCIRDRSKKVYTTLAVLFVIWCFSAICLHWNKTSRNEIIFKDYGTVLGVEYIRSGKYSAYFRITTDKVVWDSINIRNFPDDNVRVGDILSEQIIITQDSAKYYICKNGMCSQISTCYSWMPCFNKYEKG